jgi:MFS family permease
LTSPARTTLGRDFTWFWSSLGAGALGGQIGAFVLPTTAIVLFQASNLEVGGVNAASTAAYPVLGLLAGVLADRVRRGRLMVVADVVRALAFAWIPLAAALGVLDTLDLVLVALVVGAAGLVFDIAAQWHLPTLLPPSRLPVANARIETSTAIAALAGPAIGGVAIAWVGGPNTLGLAATLLAVSVLAVARLRIRQPAAATPRGRRRLSAEMREGVHGLLRHPLLGPTTVAGTLRSLGNSATATIALVFAYRALDLTPVTVGALLTVSGLAGAAGAWLTPGLTTRWGTGRTLVVACASGTMWMLAPLAFLLPAIPVYLAIAAVAAACTPVWNTTVTTLRQAVTPTELLGRVHATARTFTFSAVPIGALLGGAGTEVLSEVWGATRGLASPVLRT